MQLLVPVFFGLYAAALQVSMAAMEIGSWTLFALFLTHFIKSGCPWRELKTGVEIPFAMFFVAVAIGAFTSHMPVHEAVDKVGWTRWIILVYAYYFLTRHYLKASWEKGHLAWIGLSIVLGVYSFVQFQWGYDLLRPQEDLAPYGAHWRAQGFFNLCLTFAYEIGMVGISALALALVYARRNETKKSVFAGICYVFGCLAIMSTLTRGAWLSYGIASAIVVLIFSPRRGVPIVLGALATTAIMIWKVPALHERFFSIFNTTSDVSNTLRFLIWKTNWMIFQDHPILGVGLGQNTILSPEYYAKLGMSHIDFYSHAHDNVLEFLSCTGLVGTVGYIWFSAFFVWKAWQLYSRSGWDQAWFKAIGLGSLGAQLHFHIGGLTECNFLDAEVNHTLIFIWAITLGTFALVRMSVPSVSPQESNVPAR